jgi:hypothetical protein
MRARLISFHHRLDGMTGHRYPEALGLLAAAPARGMDFTLLMNENADASVRAAFPQALAVLHCPVFRKDSSFDERTADFVAMLHRHMDPLVRMDDRLLVTTATQCEVRALTAWIARTPANKRPWVLALFHSDRWNRYGAQERDRQVGEFKVVASELAGLDPDAARRLLIAGTAEELCLEVGGLLATPVRLAPQVLPGNGYVPPPERSANAPAMVGILGGARPEKGSHLIPAIIGEGRRLGPVDFTVQLANEQLPEPDFARLCALAAEPGVRVARGPLDQATYRSLLASCDLLLLPYDRLCYRQRTSGIFVEAAFTGRPVVVPAETWMGREVAAGTAAGIAYEGDDAAAIAQAVIRASHTLDALAARAKERAADWQRTMTLDAFLDWLESAIADQAGGGKRWTDGLGRAARDWLAGRSLRP